MLGLDPLNRNESQAQAYHFPFIYTEGATLLSAGTHHNGSHLSPHLGNRKGSKDLPNTAHVQWWRLWSSLFPIRYHDSQEVFTVQNKCTLDPTALVHSDGCKTPWPITIKGPLFMVHSHGSKHGPRHVFQSTGALSLPIYRLQSFVLNMSGPAEPN